MVAGGDGCAWGIRAMRMYLPCATATPASPDGARSAQIRRPPGRHADAGMQTAAWTPDFRFASSGEAEWGRRVDHPAGSRFHSVAQVGCRGWCLASALLEAATSAMTTQPGIPT